VNNSNAWANVSCTNIAGPKLYINQEPKTSAANPHRHPQESMLAIRECNKNAKPKSTN